MKTYLLILATLTTLAHAQTYPHMSGMDKLVTNVVMDRKAKAPYYAESLMSPAIPVVMEIARPVDLPELDRLMATPASMIPPCATELTPGAVAESASSLRGIIQHPRTLTFAEAFERAATLRDVASRPFTSSVSQVSQRTLDSPAPNKPLELLVAIPVKPLPAWTAHQVDPFMVKVEFVWDKPHGQWMNSLLKQINAARAAGDAETYNALTARYTTWAEKYLRSDAPPDLDGKPGR